MHDVPETVLPEADAKSVRSAPTGDVETQLRDGILILTIDRPSKRNALTQAMYSTMADALDEANSNDEIRTVVITGVGDVFTAGNDLVDFATGENLDEVARFLSTISTVHVPIVAAVNGLAIGVGLTLLLHCDLVYVEPTAKLWAPFVELGLVPEAASSLLLPRVIGERRATELILCGRRIDGREAAEWGLANAAVTPVLEVALEAAHVLAAQPPRALRASKHLLRSDEQTVRGRMAEEMTAFGEALSGSEFARIIGARLQAE